MLLVFEFAAMLLCVLNLQMQPYVTRPVLHEAHAANDTRIVHYGLVYVCGMFGNNNLTLVMTHIDHPCLSLVTLGGGPAVSASEP